MDASKRTAAKNANVAKVDSIEEVSLAFAQAPAARLAAECLGRTCRKKHRTVQGHLGFLENRRRATRSTSKKSVRYYNAAMQAEEIDMPNPAKKRTPKTENTGTGDMAPDIVMNDPSMATSASSVTFAAKWCFSIFGRLGAALPK